MTDAKMADVSESAPSPQVKNAEAPQGRPGSENRPSDMEPLLVGLSIFLVIVTFPLSLLVCFKIVAQYERAVIFRLGRLRAGDARGPGLFFILPCIDEYVKVDLRTVSFDVPPQEILTKDSVTVAVDAVVYYKVREPLLAVVSIVDYCGSTRLLAAAMLRNALGTRDLSQVLSDREAISHMLRTSLDSATDPWGVEVERVEIKDVRLPVQLQRAMATEAEAVREARAKIIVAKGEVEAAQSLGEAAETISRNPMALQLRYLQTLTAISSEKSNTVVFPFPLDLMKHYR